MDDLTRALWRAADAALLAEVVAERDKRPARDMMAAAMKRLRAWQALIRHRRQVHRAQVEDKREVDQAVH
jgi:hypothetical protein